MLVNEIYNNKQNEVNSRGLEANFVSSLQKASQNQSSKKSKFLEQCNEYVISSKSSDAPSVLPIDGGSDAGMFCVIGAKFDSSRVNYHKLAARGQVKIKPGDIILAMNGFEISGYTKRDAITLCTALLQRFSQLRLYLSPPHALTTSSTMLSSFLAASFLLDSPEYTLQEKIRENVYQRVVPCTTRLPRVDEVEGVHYRFMNVPQFLAFEQSGQLLESGMYKGNHYGTPRPDPTSTALDLQLLEQLKSVNLMDTSQMSDESCQIPPPLPPLSSFTTALNAVGNSFGLNPSDPVNTTSLSVFGPAPVLTSSSSSPLSSSSSNSNSSSHTSLSQSTVSSPPQPPVRNSSMLTKQPLSGLVTSNDSTSSPYVNMSAYPVQQSVPIESARKSNQATAHTTMVSAADQMVVRTTLDGVGKQTTTVFTTASSSIRVHYDVNCSTLDEFYSDQAAFSVDQKLSPGSNLLNGDQVLPYGWEIVQDPKYGTFYIDHINKHTQYEAPTVKDFELAEQARVRLLDELEHLTLSSKTSPGNGVTVSSSGGSSTMAQAACLDERQSPTTFTTDVKQLRGPLVSTNLVKSPRGFGFTIIGGSDCNRALFLQVKYLVPGGPASLNSCLKVGDVMVSVNGLSVLGYTHAQLVSLFQSIPVGSNVTLVVSQGYRLRHDAKVMVSSTHDSEVVFAKNDPILPSGSSFTNASPSDLPIGSTTPSPSSSGGAPSRFGSTKTRLSNRPEFLKVSIYKQSNGFGFTLADHLQGQHVKAISDPGRCGRLQVGDVVVEINNQRVKEMSHLEVVHILKQCPVGLEARLLVQRGGLYTSPLSLLDPDDQSNLNAVDVNYSDSMNASKCESEFSPVVSQLEQLNNVNLAYTASQLQRSNLTNKFRPDQSHYPMTLINGNVGNPSHTVDGDSIDNVDSHVRARTPDVSLDRQLGLSSTTAHFQPLHLNGPLVGLGGSPGRNGKQRMIGQDDSELSFRVGPIPASVLVDRRQRMYPIDDSLVGLGKDMYGGDSPTSSTTTYGSLLRSSRMLPLRQSQHSKCSDDSASSCMLPGEYIVHLKRQATGFGFNLVGGAEENTQVSIGGILMGGSAQLSGVMRTGDQLISIDGIRIFGASHSEVVQLLDRAAHTVGQVTLGLQRSNSAKIMNVDKRCQLETVDVILFRGEKGDGFGFLLTNNARSKTPDNGSIVNGRQSNGVFIAKLVPGSQADRMGLIHVGDQILAVNGIPIVDLHYDEVVRLIRDSGSHIALKILPCFNRTSRGNGGIYQNTHHNLASSSSGNAVEFSLTLFRGTRGFGFSIRGGQEFNRMPLLVLRIADGGAAQMDGRLRVGDELIEINGYSTVGMSHGKAIEIIQGGGNTMRLVVRRCVRVRPPLLNAEFGNDLNSWTNALAKRIHRRSMNKYDHQFYRFVTEITNPFVSKRHLLRRTTRR